MTDSMTFRMERQICERTYDLRKGSERALDVRESLRAELDAIWRFIPRQDAARLEELIDALCGVPK